MALTKKLPAFIDTERFFKYVEKTDLNGCWEWKGEIKADGYGRFNVYGGGRKFHYPAHRISFYLSNNLVIDENKVLDHTCRNRSCCNPKHLREVTHRQNVLENSEGLSAGYYQRIKCSNGHSLFVYGRTCKECEKASWKRKRIRAKAKKRGLEDLI